MRRVRLIAIAVLIAVTVASMLPYVQFSAHASDVPKACNQGNPQCLPPGFFFKPKFTYTVKFICSAGFSNGPNDATLIGLEPGLYQTDINIHNPSYSQNDEPLVEKFVMASPESQQPGPPAIQTITAVPSPYVLRWVVLKPDAATRLDCGEIASLLSGPGVASGVAKGFLIIYSDTDTLDVWAEYTAQGQGTNVGFAGAPAVQLVRIEPAPFTL